MELPVTLQNRIVDFLTSLPNIADNHSQQALINRASLDAQLHRQINFSGSAGQFFEMLVPTLAKYEQLEDGRHALVAVLEAAKDRVGRNKRAECDDLIQEVRNILKKLNVTEKKGQTSYSPEQEQELIEWIASFAEPESQAIALMAIAYHRITPEILEHLIGTPKEKGRIVLLEKLKRFPFVITKEENVVVLREDMRQTVLQKFWNIQDRDRTFRQSIAKDLLRYYDEQLLTQQGLSDATQETYALEALEYAFLADPKNGLNRFRKELEQAKRSGNDDYYKILCEVAEKYHHENPFDFDFSEILVTRLFCEAKTGDELVKGLETIQAKYEVKVSPALLGGFQEYFAHQRIDKVAQQNVPIRILHLSDLHFRPDDRVPVKLEPLVQDLYDKNEGFGFDRLDYLVISGDLTEYATPAEFILAREFITRLREEFHFQACIITPGNHDQSWERLWRSGEEIYRWRPERLLDATLKKDTLKRGDGYLVVDVEHYHERFKNFADFCKDLLNDPYPLPFNEQCRQYFFPETGIQFLTLNSCWEIDELFQDRASIHEEALATGLENARKNLRQSGKSDGILRIAVLHHPPVAGREGIRNDAFVDQLRKANVALILHGHVHETKREVIGYEHKQVHVAGAGSFGAPAASRPESTPRLYNLLEIQRDHRRIRVYTRQLDKPTGAWKAWTNWSTDDPMTCISYYDIHLLEKPTENQDVR